MELEQLRIFLAVAEEKSFTKAANSLFVSHSTVSRSVSALENELGVSLLERNNRVLGLTEAGEHLCLRAAELLKLADEIEAEIRNI